MISANDSFVILGFIISFFLYIFAVLGFLIIVFIASVTGFFVMWFTDVYDNSILEVNFMPFCFVQINICFFFTETQINV